MTQRRYRCAACGNLTRFDVTTTRTTRAYHHYTVGGDLQTEDEVVLSESVDEVSCRWCGNGRSVELVATEGPAAGEPERPAGVEPPNAGAAPHPSP